MTSGLFEKFSGAITMEFQCLENISLVGYGKDGSCFTANVNKNNRNDLLGLDDKVLIKWVVGKQPSSEIAYLLNLWCLGHPNIVQPFTIIIENKTFAVIVCDKKFRRYAVTMKAVVPHNQLLKTLALENRITIFAQLADCLHFLDIHGLCHMKNYIINEKYEPILIDIGSMSNSSPLKDSYHDIISLWDVFLDLELSTVNVSPLEQWGEAIINNISNLLPTSAQKVCTELGAMSIGPLSLLTGCTTEKVNIKYVHLQAADISQLPNEDIIKTCYSPIARIQQRANITVAVAMAEVVAEVEAMAMAEAMAEAEAMAVEAEAAAADA